MSSRTLSLTDPVHAYLLQVAVTESAPQRRLREVTAEMPAAMMQISPEQGAFMSWLVRLLGARRAIEVGTFTGYSALTVASALPPDGTLLCCDINDDFASVGRPFWHEAGVAERIDLRIAPAAETLARLLEDGEAGRWDFAFIDADKPLYDTYYEQCLELLRPGGVVAIDNVLWGGSVADPTNETESTLALRALNRKVFSDERVEASMIPIGDGLTLARKR